MRRPTERARAARASVAATSGEQRRLGGGWPSSRCGHGRVTTQRSTAQETRRVQRRRRRPSHRATAECRAVANAAADRAGASGDRERRRDERRAAATRRRAAVESSRPRACDRAEEHGARNAPRSAQEAKAAASSGGRVSGRRECGGRPSGRKQRARASPRRAASSSDSTAVAVEPSRPRRVTAQRITAQETRRV
jgi:hypothetical protein